MNIFQTPLAQFINKGHELCQLADQIDWQSVENEFSSYYCPDNGRPSIPIRKIVGVLLLKMMFSHSDESVVKRWQENPYWQYFCGETFFQHEKPFDPTELIKFRKRICEEGAGKLLKLSLNLFSRKEVEEKEVCIDTTVQEKNITYPTDAKLRKKIIEKCWGIAEKGGINLRQSYRRTLKQLMIDQRFREHPKRRRKANAAARKIDTIAGRVVRDLERKLTSQQKQAYEEDSFQKDIIGNIDQNKRNGSEHGHLFDELLYKCRFVVERTNAWLDAFKAILVEKTLLGKIPVSLCVFVCQVAACPGAIFWFPGKRSEREEHRTISERISWVNLKGKDKKHR